VGCNRVVCASFLFDDGGGVEDDLLIVTCIHSGLSGVALVEALDCSFCIVQVWCRVPDFVVFW